MATSAPTSSYSHRPRKKRKLLTASSSNSNLDLILDMHTSKASPAFPLVAFLWPARAGVSQWLVLPLILMIVGLFRWTTSLWGYSGRFMLTHHPTALRAKEMQATEVLQCMVILKLRGTGWSLLFTCPFLCGISMTSSGGALTIPP